MHNSIYMQFKREFWEHKSIAFTVPMIFSSILALAFTGVLIYSLINNEVQIRANGQLSFSEHISQNQLLFDGKESNALANMAKVDHFFVMNDNQSMQDYPELLKENSVFQDITQPYESAHVYETWLDSRYYRFVGIFNVILLLLIITPFMQSLTADKKDHSILFWRSLPVSETRNVLTKVMMLLVITPVIYHLFLYISLLCCLILFSLVESVISPLGGVEITQVYTKAYFGIMQMSLSFAFILLWFLPLYSLLAFLSSFSSKSLWAILPFVYFAVVLLELRFLGTEYLTEGVKNYLSTGIDTAQLIQWHFVWPAVKPNVNYAHLLISLAVSGVLLAATIYLRRLRIR